VSVEGAKHSSEKEREAQLAERDSVDLKKAEYMSQFIGEKFTGVISSVTSFGFFVELDNTIEGLVRVENIEDDYYVYNEKTYSLIGEHTKKVYKIGDQVKVKLVKADMEIKKIDFEVI
jgi:ribonuclease R